MHNPQEKNSYSSQKVDWLEYLNDCQPALVIPVGSRFQADAPEWSGKSKTLYLSGDTDTSRWLGTRVWPLEDDAKDGIGKIGKGRPDMCNCSLPGSPQCVKQHTWEARARLKSTLGPAFKSWKFDEMGDDVGNSWTLKQKNIFENLVKANPLSQHKSFLRPAELSFPSKTRKDIISYYLNVHIPECISKITRSGRKVLNSDDDEVEEASVANNSLKRSRLDNDDNTKLVKSHYLTGRR